MGWARRIMICLLVLQGLRQLPVVRAQAPAPAGNSAQLRVVTEPPGARIYRNDVFRDTAPVTLTDLPPGSHRISARLPGYHEARVSISLEAGQRTPLDFKLEPITGLVIVHSEPPDVDITINGAHRGRTPLLLTDLTVGRHRAAAQRPGYLPMEIDIEVQNRTPQKVELALRPDSARFRVDSVPRGASVFIDGILRGTTPCDIDRVPSGECEIEIQLEDHRPFRRRFTLQAGDEHTVHAELEALPGAMRLTSVPSGARIYINDVPRGETPLLIETLSPGEYRVRVEARGYATETAEITVQRNAVNAREFRLRRDSGTIILTTEPAEVRALIDGEEVGITAPGESDVLSLPLTIDLVARGRRTLQLSRQGYYPLEITVEIEAGRTVTRHERLRRRFIPDTRIRIGTGPSDVLIGIVTQRYPNGDIEIEIRPGIFRTVEKQRILSEDPLTVRPSD